MTRHFLALLGGLLIGTAAGPSVAASVYGDEKGNAESANAFNGIAVHDSSSLTAILSTTDEASAPPTESFALTGGRLADANPMANVNLPKPNLNLPAREFVVDAAVDVTSLTNRQDRSTTAFAPQESPASAAQGLLWKGALLLMPAIGGMLLAFDFRGNRRTGRNEHVETIKLYDSAPVSRRRHVPAALAALGLTPDCTEEDVKRAYRERAKTAHPDHGGDARQFIELQRNFEQALRLVRSNSARNAFHARPATRRAA